MTPDASTGPDATVGFAEGTHDTVPQVQSGGGPVLAAPVVQPIFFANDATVQATVEDFLGQLGPSAYWAQVGGEYGVGPTTILPTIIATDSPPADDGTLSSWLASQMDGTHTAAGWPAAPDPNTIYSVFLPQGATFAGACSSFGAYHSEGTSTQGPEFVYALMPRCEPSGIDASTSFDATAELTVATSHELLEASTDPFPFSDDAYDQMDDAHFIWARTPGAELGDMCEYVETANQQLVGNYYVQRIWSNASAAAGHDPCVPAPAGPYLGVAPMFSEDISVATHGQTVMTKGVSVAYQTSKTIEVDLFTDADGAADYEVTAEDAATITQTGTPTLAFQWGEQSGNNGTKLQLIITRTKMLTSSRGSEILISALKDGKKVSMWWGYVAP